jgi:hypothetical protein
LQGDNVRAAQRSEVLKEEIDAFSQANLRLIASGGATDWVRARWGVANPSNDEDY